MATLEQAALSGALTTITLTDPSDPDGREPQREPDDEDEDDPEDLTPEDDDYAFTHEPTHASSAISRGWSGNTGPKGVLLDFKASHGKSGAILGGGDPRCATKHSSRLSSSRKKSPGSPSETDSESDKDTRQIPTTSSLYTSGRRTHRIIDRRAGAFSRKSSGSPPSISPIRGTPNSRPAMLDSRGKKLFGHLREVGVDNFIQAVEAEKDDKETVVLVHLYDPALESCAVLNAHLSSLARLYPRTKFLRALASELDFFNSSASTQASPSDFTFPSLSPSASPRSSYTSEQQLLIDASSFGIEAEERRDRKPTDSDILPTLLWYRAGEYVQSLPAMERELPGGVIKRGEKGCTELSSLLSKFGIIS